MSNRRMIYTKRIIDKTYTPTVNTVGLYYLNGDCLDYSGNNRHGTPSSTLVYQSGKFGQCAFFNGVNSLTASPQGGIITLSNFPTPRTISAWIYKTGTTVGDDCIFVKWGVVAYGYELTFFIDNANKPHIYAYSFAENFVSSTAITLNAWNHVCYTNSGIDGVGTSYIYLNGVQVASTPTRYLTNNDIVYIGAGIYPTNSLQNAFHGKIDEIILENVQWSGTQVSDYYNTYKNY